MSAEQIREMLEHLKEELLSVTLDYSNADSSHGDAVIRLSRARAKMNALQASIQHLTDYVNGGSPEYPL